MDNTENIDIDAIAMSFANLGSSIMMSLIIGESIDEIIDVCKHQAWTIYNSI